MHDLVIHYYFNQNKRAVYGKNFLETSNNLDFDVTEIEIFLNFSVT